MNATAARNNVPSVVPTLRPTTDAVPNPDDALLLSSDGRGVVIVSIVVVLGGVVVVEVEVAVVKVGTIVIVVGIGVVVIVVEVVGDDTMWNRPFDVYAHSEPSRFTSQILRK